MAIPFLAGAATMSLLDDRKQPNIINNTNIYIPLSEEQADLYLTTTEYKNYAYGISLRIYYYYDRNNNLKPRIMEHRASGRKKWITFAQAKKLREKNEALLKTSDKVILMTKGIGGLPPAEKPLKEYSFLNSFNITFCLCCFPCILQDYFHYRSKENIPVLEHPNCAKETATAFCHDSSFILVDKA